MTENIASQAPAAAVDTATDPNSVEIIPDLTTVRYEGSIAEFRGVYGWVERSYEVDGQTRYDIALTGYPYGDRPRLIGVRRKSLVVGPNNG
ncbi:hypothetical protein [Nocardioides pakistanensis]